MLQNISQALVTFQPFILMIFDCLYYMQLQSVSLKGGHDILNNMPKGLIKPIFAKLTISALDKLCGAPIHF